MELVIDILALFICAFCIILGTIETIAIGEPTWMVNMSFLCGGFIGGLGFCDLVEKGWDE